MRAASSNFLSIVVGGGFDERKAAAILLAGCIYAILGPDGNGNGNGVELSGNSSHFGDAEEADVRRMGPFKNSE